MFLEYIVFIAKITLIYWEMRGSLITRGISCHAGINQGGNRAC
jgi:hypothetical protein